MGNSKKSGGGKAERILGTVFWCFLITVFYFFVFFFIVKDALNVFFPVVALVAFFCFLVWVPLKTGGSTGKSAGGLTSKYGGIFAKSSGGQFTKNGDFIAEPFTKKDLFLLLGIFAVCFLTRLVYLVFMSDKVTQISDFLVVSEEAASGLFTDRTEYYRFYIHKFFYPYLLHQIGAVTQMRIFLVQDLLVSLVPCLLYLLGRKFFGFRTGLVSAVFYIFWPVQIIYSSVVTEEHAAAVLTLLMAGCLLMGEESLSKGNTSEPMDMIRPLVLFFLGGIIAGVNSFFKDWGSVALVAAGICAVYLLVSYKGKKKLFLLLALLLLIGGRKIATLPINALAKQVTSLEANNGGVVAIHMYATLVPNAPGDYNGPLNEEYKALAAKNGYDFKATNKEAMGILADRIKAQPEKMPDLLLRKGRMAYGNNDAMFFFALEKELGEEYYLKAEKFIGVLKTVDLYYYMLMVVLACMAFFGIKKNKRAFFLELFVFGGGMVSLLVESQGRYKYSILPVWILLAGFAVENLLGFFGGNHGKKGGRKPC